MKLIGSGSTSARQVSLERLANDFKGLNTNDPGTWPNAPKLAVYAALLIVALVAAWWLVWQPQMDVLAKKEREEATLREQWLSKKRQAVNLDEHKRQLEEIDRQFGALLRQLPNRAEMDSLLAEINQAGLGRGLAFELFKPGAEAVKDFYAEMPIDIRVYGGYHDLGTFASDVAGMPRIVTLNNIAIESGRDGLLKLEAKAVTYRYLDEDELAAKQQAARAAQNPRGRRR